MASTSLFLRTPKAEQSKIVVRLRDGRDKSFVISSEYTIKTKHWNVTTKKVHSANPNATEINKVLHGWTEQKEMDGEVHKIQVEGFKDRLLNIYLDAKKKGINVTTAYLIEELKPKKELSRPKIEERLLLYIEKYLANAELKAKNKELSKETLKSYKTLKNKIKEFEKYSKKKFGITEYKVKDVDLIFYNNFKEYSLNEKNLSVGTFGNDINRLKTAIITAKEEYKIPVSDDVFSSRFKRTREKASFVTLNEDELLKIAKHNFASTPYLDNARDWLIIGCYVGQRVSDLLKLTNKNITTRKGVEYIELKQGKTDKRVTLPILPLVKSTLLKNGSEFPRKISSQKLNDYIKIVCKEVGLDKLVEGAKIDKLTKRKVSGVFEKWELIVSHDMRRSFASNHYGKLPTPVIMALTAHSTEAVFLKYINKEESHDADIVLDYYNSLPSTQNPNLKVV